MKTLWNWILTKLGKRFPLPPRHILTYEEMWIYWGMLGSWQRQCSIIVLRIRKPDTELQAAMKSSNIWKPTIFPTKADILDYLGAREPHDPFTIRIDREWERQPGIKVKEEVCIANFEL